MPTARPIPVHRLLALLAFAVLVTGCGDPLKAKLVGTWELDTSRVTSELPKGTDKGGLGDALKKVIGKAVEEGVKGTIVLREDGTGIRKGSVLGASSKEAGFWKVVSSDGTSGTIQLSDTKTFEKYEQWTVKLIDDDTFEAKGEADDKWLTFKRKPAGGG